MRFRNRLSLFLVLLLVGFQAATVARDIGDVRLAGRFDAFRTRKAVTPALRAEDGKALTLAVSWFADEHIRLSGETILLTSDRPARAMAGDPAKADEIQVQASLQLSF